MPELPEIETLKRKIEPRLMGVCLTAVTLLRPDLRFPITTGIGATLKNQKVTTVGRRSKYLLIGFANNKTLIIHLGMSGRLFFTTKERALDRHDHVLFDFADGLHLRFRDVRRFGCVLMEGTNRLAGHPLLCNLGVEPLGPSFNAAYLWPLCSHSGTTIKSLLMNSKHVVGIGNIYANEALFKSGIRPTKKARTITKPACANICARVKEILGASIASGGTSFRDYVDVDEKPGLHQLNLMVYNRAGKPCRICNTPIKKIVQTGRSSFYCPRCQK